MWLVLAPTLTMMLPLVEILASCCRVVSGEISADAAERCNFCKVIQVNYTVCARALNKSFR